MVITCNRCKVWIIVDSCETARLPDSGCDRVIGTVKQHAALNKAILNDAARIVCAGQQIGSAYHRPPSVGECGSEKPERKEHSQRKIRLRLEKRCRFFIQMITDQDKDKQGNEGG